MLSTSLRSAIHATDSTWSGWTAKSSATAALRPGAPVRARRTAKSSAAFAAWSAAFTRWGPAGVTPNSSTSSMCESQVSGCQLATSSVVKAQVTPDQDSPARTRSLAWT